MLDNKRQVGSKNAAPTTFGFEFQVIVGILLALQYIDRLQYVAIEGEDQDIEIRLNNNNMIYCQAKSTSKLPSQPGFNSGWSKQLASGMDSLFRDYLDMKNKGLVIKKFIYAVNYFFPLGKEKGNSRGFGKSNIGIYGNELYKSQIKNLIKHLKLQNKDSNGNIAPKIKRNISKFKNNFLKKLEITIYNFLRYKDPKTRYISLRNDVQNFLSSNYLNVNTKQLSHFWKSVFYFNSTTDGKVHISRQQFLMSIYAINIFEETQYNALSIKDPDINKKRKLLNNYQDFIIFNQNSTKFIGMINEDLIKFFNLKSSKDLMHLDIEDNRKKKLFVKEFGHDFEPLFNIKDIKSSNISTKFMTKYAITDWLNKISKTSYLLEGNLTSVN